MPKVKISAAQARQQFAGCSPDFIRDVCHAHCCESSTSPSGISVAIAPSEIGRITARGGVVKDGLLLPREGERRCCFKTPENLCGLHATPDKPLGCRASPFTLTSRDTLIVRNRYRMLKCFRAGSRRPAYAAFRYSIDSLFGEAEGARIAAHLDAGGGDLEAEMLPEPYEALVTNRATRKAAKEAAR